jgi:IS30 family transposase
MSISDISILLKVDKNDIYRELKRNCDSRSRIYKSLWLQRKYEEHLFNKTKKAAPKLKAKIFELNEAD